VQYDRLFEEAKTTILWLAVILIGGIQAVTVECFQRRNLERLLCCVLVPDHLSLDDLLGLSVDILQKLAL